MTAEPDGRVRDTFIEICGQALLMLIAGTWMVSMFLAGFLLG